MSLRALVSSAAFSPFLSVESAPLMYSLNVQTRRASSFQPLGSTSGSAHGLTTVTLEPTGVEFVPRMSRQPRLNAGGADSVPERRLRDGSCRVASAKQE